MKEREFDRVVGKDKWKIRLDKYLVESGVGISRSEVQRLIGAGRVLVDGKKVKAHHLLKGGEKVTCTYDVAEKIAVEAEDIPINVVYEDNDVIIVDKQAGIVVHPVRGNLHGTLVNALLHHCKTLSEGGDMFLTAVVAIFPVQLNNDYENLSWELNITLMDTAGYPAVSLPRQNRSSGISASAAESRAYNDMAEMIQKDFDREFTTYLTSFLEK